MRDNSENEGLQSAARFVINDNLVLFFVYEFPLSDKNC